MAASTTSASSGAGTPPPPTPPRIYILEHPSFFVRPTGVDAAAWRDAHLRRTSDEILNGNHIETLISLKLLVPDESRGLIITALPQASTLLSRVEQRLLNRFVTAIEQRSRV